MALIVSAETRLPRFSSIQSLISLVLFPIAYRPIIRSETPSARMVSRFLINWGSNSNYGHGESIQLPRLRESEPIFAFSRYDGYPFDVPRLSDEHPSHLPKQHLICFPIMAQKHHPYPTKTCRLSAVLLPCS